MVDLGNDRSQLPPSGKGEIRVEKDADEPRICGFFGEIGSGFSGAEAAITPLKTRN